MHLQSCAWGSARLAANKILEKFIIKTSLFHWSRSNPLSTLARWGAGWSLTVIMYSGRPCLIVWSGLVSYNSHVILTQARRYPPGQIRHGRILKPGWSYCQSERCRIIGKNIWFIVTSHAISTPMRPGWKIFLKTPFSSVKNDLMTVYKIFENDITLEYNCC